MPEEFTPQKAKEALEEIREKVKKYGVDSHEFKNAVDKTEKALEAQEKKSEEFVKSMAKAEQTALDLKEQVDTLELEVARKSETPHKDWKDTDAYRTLTKWIKEGDRAITDAEAKTLEAMDLILSLLPIE